MKHRLLAYAAILGLCSWARRRSGPPTLPSSRRGRCGRSGSGLEPGSVARGAFNDGAWPSGAAQLGYGDGGEATVVGYGPNAGAKYITTYFRHAFSVSDPTGYQSLTLNLLPRRRGGGVLERHRSIPQQHAHRHRLVHDAGLRGDRRHRRDHVLSRVDHPSLLVAGTNVLAVEVHQANGTSSDVSFDAELIGSLQRAAHARTVSADGNVDHARCCAGAPSAATDSRVRLGASPASADDDGRRRRRRRPSTRSRVTGLAPSTVYYYSVGSTTADARRRRRQSLLRHRRRRPGTAEPTRVWVLGDAGTAGPTGISANQTAVRERLRRVQRRQLHGPDPDARRQRLRERHRCRVPGRRLRHVPASFLRQSNLWPTIGNHDTAQSTESERRDAALLQHLHAARGRRGGRRRLGHREVLLVRLRQHPLRLPRLDDIRAARSTARCSRGSPATSPPTPSRGSIAFWHHPPYTKGSHDSDTETS